MLKSASIATGSGHLGQFLSRSKWVLPGHINMPDLDQKYTVILRIKNCNKRSILSKRAVTDILRMRPLIL